ncbi:uncharacterized protein JCM10292_000212 [Rhodotorula paludigena]|uniref:uncharacterized protein n=1 Tax=Rhodotorula paludigena TaxID=86838 RepID=UPI00317B2F6B
MSFVVTEPIPEGVVVLHTSLGDILIELWRRECPKAVRNFVQLCLEGHYDGVPFHRVMPNFIAQTGGDDDCIYDEGSFPIETNQRLKFNRRGLVAMASDPDTKSNMSQFFFTLEATPELQNKHTLFGRIAGDSIFNLLKLQEVELEPGTDRPLYPPVIKRAEVRVDPFEDGPDPIRPRITADERREQERAKKEMKAERAKERQQGKRKGTKNNALLSFGADADDAEDASSSLPKTKFKSAHDALQDSRLSSRVIDDRGVSAQLPPELIGGGLAASAREDKGKKRAADEAPREEKRLRAEPAVSRLDEARKLKDKAPKSEAERRREEIAKLEAELKGGNQRAGSSEPASKKPKGSGPSLLQLEREKYSAGGKASRGGKRRAGDDDDVMSALEGFRSKLFQAAKSAPKEDEVEEEAKEKEREERERLHGIDLNDDELAEDTEGWMTHSLKFRKDATLDQHSIDEYAVVDPLAKNSLTLDEMRGKDQAQRRRYPGEPDRDRGEGSSRGGGRDDRRGGGGGRNRYEGGSGRYGGGGGGGGGGGYGRDGRDNRGGDRGSGYGQREDRPEVRGDWKKDRMSTSELA